MVRSGTTTKSKVVALAASVALSAGSLVAMAPVAAAAPGDITPFPLGADTEDLAQGPAGNLWVTLENGVIAKVALDGTSIGYQTNTRPGAIATGSDGYMWFTNQAANQIGKISPEGAVQLYSNNTNNPARDIVLGADGNMWFTVPGAQQVGKITSDGNVTLYGTGGIEMDWITPGPEGSNRVYLASDSDNKLGFVTFAGNFTDIDGPATGVDNYDIQLINDQVWFISAGVGGVSALTRLVGDNGFTQVSNAALGNPASIGVGIGGTMWVTSGNLTISHLTTAGDLVANYPFGLSGPSLLQADDGNVWIAAGDLERLLTGVVPTSSAAPVVEPSSGLVAGATASVSNGSWNYLPTSYAYQWQVCETSEATSCTDVPGATGQNYTVATTDVGKYIRAGVRASNLNGASQPAYSGLVATGAAPAPAPAPAPLPATGEIADVGNGVVMVLDAPNRQKRKQRKTYDVVFSATDVQGTVTFEFRKNRKNKKNRVQTRTVVIEDGVAEVRWRVPRKWPRKGRTTVTATFIPAAGSPYQAAETRDRVRIRK